MALELQKAKLILSKPSVYSQLSPKQSIVLRSNHKKIALDWARRTGKTVVEARMLVKCAKEKPGSISAYCGPTKDQAQKLISPQIESELIRQNIKYRYDMGRMIYRIDSSEIQILGLNALDDQDRLRGHVFHLVIIDEAQSIRQKIRTIIEEATEPTLMDHDGTLVLSGTPGPIPTGYFYEAATGKKLGWWTIKATLHDNIYFPKWRLMKKDYNPESPDAVIQCYDLAEAELARVRAEHGWTTDNLSYRREYLGEWCRDQSVLIYKIDDDNVLVDTPEISRYNLCVNLTYMDRSTYSVVGYDLSRKIYEVETLSIDGRNLELIARKIRECIERYKLEMIWVVEGQSKKLVDELRSEYGIICMRAMEEEKFTAIDLLNNSLAAHQTFIRSSSLVEVFNMLGWEFRQSGFYRDENLTNSNRVENDSVRNDESDAFLYAWLWCYRTLPSKSSLNMKEEKNFYELVKEDILAENDIQNSKSDFEARVMDEGFESRDLD